VKILFIGNNASRTGAPIGLLCFLRWLKENTDVEFEILLRVGRGPLLQDYEALAPVVCYDRIDNDPNLTQRIARRLGLRKLGGRSCLSAIEQRFQNSGLDVIHANTITHGAILADLARLRLPVVCYVHELEWGIERYGCRNVSQVRRHTKGFVAASQAVKQNLVDRHRIPSDKVDVIHEMLPPRDPPLPGAVAAVKAELGLRESDFVVGGCGFHAWRKGRDLFVDLARTVHSRHPNRDIRFVWVGGEAGDEVEVERLPMGGEDKLKPILRFVPEVDNPLDYFATFDVFAMVSREDPYPIVNLECASLAKPILCFEQSGGSPEFVGDDAGFVIPHLDVRAMAEKVLLLAEDRKLLDQFGSRAADKAREHDVSKIAPRLFDVIRQMT